MRIPSKPSIIMPAILICCHFSYNLPSLPRAAVPTIEKVGQIPVPVGYKRLPEQDGFCKWLRDLPVLADRRVFLYNGSLKQNQEAQFAVLDVPVGKKNLQQCADACMRLRAEYLRSMGKTSEILFMDNARRVYQPAANCSPRQFEAYLEKVFTYCGTLSLENQLKRIPEKQLPAPGDLLIQGGSPGHAMMVMDKAMGPDGEAIYLLAQSYMPAQQIHILKNPGEQKISPWYQLRSNTSIVTPEWTFHHAVFRRW
jgi:hypothetical protein